MALLWSGRSKNPIANPPQVETPPPWLADETLTDAARETLTRLDARDAEEAKNPLPAWPEALTDVPLQGGPRLRAQGWYAVEESSGTVLAAHNASQPLPIASIAKLMGGLIYADAGADPEASLPLTQEDKNYLQVTRSRLRVGGQYPAHGLLHSALLSSDNRAMVMLMGQTGLTREQFAAAMNRRARALGLPTAHFGDPTGLDPTDTASPREVALLLAASLRHPLLSRILVLTEYPYLRTDSGIRITARSSNRLAYSPDWRVSGSKTGYTDLAGSCLVMRCSMAGRTVVVALLGARGVHSRYGDAVRLRGWLEGLSPEEEAKLAQGEGKDEEEGGEE